MSIYGIIGAFTSIMGLIDQGLILLIANTHGFVEYVDEFIFVKIVGGALASYIKMLRNLLLGGILIGGGLQENKKKK